MNILYLAHRIPYPPDKGDKLRAFRQIERLARLHKVWCACFVDSPRDYRHLPALREYCVDLAAIELRPVIATGRGMWGLLRGRTVTESYYASAAMRATVGRWAGTVGFDAVVAFSSSMAAYALAAPAGRRILDLCDRDSQKWLDYSVHSSGLPRRLYRIEGQRLARCERSWIEAFDASILITAAEAAPLRNLAASSRLHVVGNGVLLPALQPADRDASCGAPELEPLSGMPDGALLPTVGFVGMMNYRANVDAVRWFVETCWPRIVATHPRAVFRIVGRRPGRSVRRLSRIKGVQVVGGVDDALDEVRRFDVSVAPMRIARGLQNKVLEAMAAARPVVLTSRAAEGIEATAGRDFVIADSPDEIGRCVAELLSDPSARRRLGESARRYVAQHHRWNVELDKFELIVTGATTASVARATESGRQAPEPHLRLVSTGP